jgi:alpha-glucosidase
MQSREWWRGALVYQIYPRSFLDTNGDGIGDLCGVTAKLDYIASLGVDAIWLSPFYTSPMRDFGYDIADHRSVDPVFGTLDDFDTLVLRAHGLGIKIIIDQVWGHTSTAHEWFRSSVQQRSASHGDWYVWSNPKPDGTPPNNWLSVFGGPAWTWEPRRRQYYLHHFLASQPTLNLRQPAVVDALLDVARFWLERGVDGFRLDALDFLLHDPSKRDNPPAAPRDGILPAKLFALQHHVFDMVQPDVPLLLRRLRALADIHPGTALLGEVSSQSGAFARIADYTMEAAGIDMAYTLLPVRAERVENAVNDALAQIEAVGDAGTVCWAFSNHDVERVASRWNPLRDRDLPPDPAFVRMLMALLLSLRGTVCLYQGEELGLPDAVLDAADLQDPFGIAYFPEFRGRDGSRTPIPWDGGQPQAGFTSAPAPWLPVSPEHHRLSVADQEKDSASMLRVWRRLAARRRAHPALRHGTLQRLDLPPPLIGFERAASGERIVALFNPGESPVRLSLAAYAGARRLDDMEAGARVEGGDLVLPAYGTYFASLTEAAASVEPGSRSSGRRTSA